MISKLLNDYNLISKEIEIEKQADLDRMFDSLVLSFTKQQEETQTDDKDWFRQHEKNMFALRCLRIAVNFRLITNGYYKKKEQLDKDIEDAIENVKNIEYAWNISEAVLKDTLEVLLNICSDCGEVVLTYFENKYNLTVRDFGEITPDLYFLFIMIIDYYKQNGREELAVDMLEGLYELSSERNPLEIHQELVVKVIELLGEMNVPDRIVQIGDLENKNFEASRNEYAGEFLWLYGSALEQLSEFDEAVNVLKQCYSIRSMLYGEGKWYTDIVKREYSLLRYTTSGGMDDREYLCSFVDNIESGLYKNMDEDILAVIEGKTLYIMLMNWAYIENANEYDFYLSLYESICEVYNDCEEPLLKVRLAKNLRGGYYLKMGDYLQAEMAFIDALDAEMLEGVPEIITEGQIKQNLLIIYCVQNDMKMAIPLLSELLDVMNSDEEASTLTEKDIYRIYTSIVCINLQLMEEVDENEVQECKEIIHDACLDVLDSPLELKEYAREVGMFIVYAIIWILQIEQISKKEMQFYMRALCKMKEEKEIFSFDMSQMALLNYILGILSWNLNDSRTVGFFRKSLEYSESALVPISMKASVLETAALFLGKNERSEFAVQYMDEALNKMTVLWQSYVRYLNDDRLMQILMPIQLMFSGCYAMLRKHSGVEVAYERVLQFKALASLAGKERNRILNKCVFDIELLEQIRGLQDRIAFLETEHIFKDVSIEYQKDKEKLRKLETEFAKKFPEENVFMDISWENVKRAIPDNVAVVEFVFCSLDYGRLQFDTYQEDISGLDVYITYKKNGVCTLKKLTIPDGEKILEQSDEFVDILQAESSDNVTTEQLYIKEDIRMALYVQLIRPILPYITGVETLYIASDYSLTNLPFEILYDEEQKTLEEIFHVIKIECARDFLYKKVGTSSVEGSLIIGNPQYELSERDFEKYRETDSEQNRMFEMDFDSIKQLPFSQIEVQRVGKYCKSVYYTGYEASKGLLSSMKGYRNIHIATHGYFDLSKQAMPMYASCLLFAGVKNWAKEEYISNRFGNGMMTADEVSRLDMTAVELVVLSSCLSGMNDVSLNKGFHGMIGALSAAGARYVVSHLWAADDFATTILMDAFYYQYMEKKQSPPVALNFARNYLKNVTIGELKRRQWFTYMKKSTIDTEAIKIIEKYENYNERMRPFKSEAYWGGFVCYQCN